MHTLINAYAFWIFHPSQKIGICSGIMNCWTSLTFLLVKNRKRQKRTQSCDTNEQKTREKKTENPNHNMKQGEKRIFIGINEKVNRTRIFKSLGIHTPVNNMRYDGFYFVFFFFVRCNCLMFSASFISAAYAHSRCIWIFIFHSSLLNEKPRIWIAKNCILIFGTKYCDPINIVTLKRN